MALSSRWNSDRTSLYANLVLHLRLGQQQALAVKVDVIAVRTLQQAGYRMAYRRHGCAAAVHRPVKLISEVDVLGAIPGRVNVGHVCRNQLVAI